MPTVTATAHDVLCYIPNIVGYARVIATLASLGVLVALPTEKYVIGILLYLASFAGDLIDGWVARKLNQTSSFGGVLDMVTDRCSTLGLLFVLYGNVTSNILKLLFLFLCILDISSHWVQMHSSLAIGQHHKSQQGNTEKHFLTRLFYSNYAFFGYLCVGAEFTYILLLVRIRTQEVFPQQTLILFIVQLLLYVSIPGCFLKQCVNVSQLLSSCHAIAAHDAKAKCQ